MRSTSPVWLVALVLACNDESGAEATGAAGTYPTTLPNLTLSGAPGETTTEVGSESQGSTTGAEATSEGAVTTGGGGPKFDLGDDTGPSTTTGPDDVLCPCAPKLDLIYVLSDDRELWTYDPLGNSFELVGPLGCPTTDGTFSMGVGRDGFAWIQTTLPQGPSNYVGDLFRLDVTNPQNCVDPNYVPGANGWVHFGMAFVSASADDPCDALYGQHWNGQAGLWSEGPGAGKLGVFDPVVMQMTTIGPTNYNGAELTGTGDGRLYAFGGVPNAKLIQFDKQTAQAIETLPFNNLPLTNAFAFAFWGGDFYFFTLGDPNGQADYSKVTKLDYDDSDNSGKALTTVHANAPIRVVGAGVSTCAPLEPPG
ncbi:hypothetical protein OV203_44060 [Nannocystis sp. ILAH1]|uniref:hypothetical protein n=1 Tax=unclassified Nannocystis TaxID=2627009 RepID=UPI00226DA020|nr:MULTISPECIES: hypothetical protein [unclassified Nannocystis]MCY0994186.1 hypothetical protein [Nannocystis sp. ILAH1]MCY1063966.1 hypothetical protein [Nannocystis sp. RBIL2]